MRAFLRIAIIAVLPLLVGACAGAVPGNPQNYAGITDAHVEVGTVKAEEKPYIKDVRFRDGKQKQSVEIKISLDEEGKPTISYTAKGIEAFDGQKVRAAVEQAVSADAKEAMPGIVDTIVKAVTGMP